MVTRGGKEGERERERRSASEREREREEGMGWRDGGGDDDDAGVTDAIRHEKPPQEQLTRARTSNG